MATTTASLGSVVGDQLSTHLVSPPSGAVQPRRSDFLWWKQEGLSLDHSCAGGASKLNCMGTPGLVRVSVGLEDPNDLVGDFLGAVKEHDQS